MGPGAVFKLSRLADCTSTVVKATGETVEVLREGSVRIQEGKQKH